jgi:hypothetical protein
VLTTRLRKGAQVPVLTHHERMLLDEVWLEKRTASWPRTRCHTGVGAFRQAS